MNLLGHLLGCLHKKKAQDQMQFCLPLNAEFSRHAWLIAQAAPWRCPGKYTTVCEPYTAPRADVSCPEREDVSGPHRAPAVITRPAAAAVLHLGQHTLILERPGKHVQLACRYQFARHGLSQSIHHKPRNLNLIRKYYSSCTLHLKIWRENGAQMHKTAFSTAIHVYDISLEKEEVVLNVEKL